MKPGDAMRLLLDPAFRRRVRRLDPDALARLGYATDSADFGDAGAPDIKVVTSTCDTMYVQLPQTPELPADGEISAQNLRHIQAAGNTAGSASSVASASSASTFGTLTSTASSGGSAGSAGTVGTAGSA